MSDPGTAPKRLSYDEILQQMEEIARDPANRDQFKALKALAATQSAGIVLPDPLSPQEMIDRLSRQMKGCGIDICQRSYFRAFPNAKQELENVTVKPDDISQEMYAKYRHIKTLKRLYHAFPETKRPGFPTGFPVGKGLAVQADWCARAAAKIILDREQARADAKLDAPPDIPETPEPAQVP